MNEMASVKDRGKTEAIGGNDTEQKWKRIGADKIE